MSWKRVCKANPCAICGKPDWCTFNPEDDASCCMRITSGIKLKNGGWLHLPNGSQPVKKNFIPPPITMNIDWRALLVKWRINTEDNQREWFAHRLGVTSKSLDQLDCAWSPEFQAWSFPMRNGEDQIVGIRLRNESGQKWAVKGSKQGIFTPQGVPPQDIVYVCEGPTDTAALLSMGLYAIGRPSNLCGVNEVNQHCKRLGIRKIVLVSDNDEAGLRGSLRASEEITIPHCTIIPPCKDVREMMQSGGTRAMLEMLVSQEVWKA